MLRYSSRSRRTIAQCHQLSLNYGNLPKAHFVITYLARGGGGGDVGGGGGGGWRGGSGWGGGVRWSSG